MDSKLTDVERKLDDMDNESMNDFKRYYGTQLVDYRAQKHIFSLQITLARFML
jgi:hypothetical protein